MRIASWLASWKGSNYSRRKTRASSKASPRPRLVPATGGTSAHSPTTAPISPEPSVSLPDKFNGNRLKLRTFLNQLELVFLNQPQPIQLGGNQGGHSRDPLNRRGCVVVQSHPREPPRQPRHPQFLASFQGPVYQDIFSNGCHSPSSSRHSAPDSREWPREYLLFTVPAN
ncbi:hypothetical protein BASA83_013210 [Batrachochytrium salamandrivorans]|nr:hypothetical protein BASA83_013210 [Batrachochytrium salamandrivorans]